MTDQPAKPAPAHPRDDQAYGKPGWFDWVARIIARAVYRAPRIAPSRFRQKGLMKQWASLGGEPFEVTTADGVRIHAMRFAGVKDWEIEQRAKPRAPSLPVVFAHGWTEIKEYHHRLARLLTSRGHEFVIYDQRAHGQSRAKFTTVGVREPDDLKAVIAGATERGWLADRYVLMGVSMGAATVLRLAARDDRVAGVVAYAPFVSFVDANRTFKQRVFRFAASEWVIRGGIKASQQWGFDIRDSAPIDCVADIKVPILYIVGDADQHLPAEHHTQRLAAVTGSDVVIVPDANHFNICFRPWEAADKAMLRFIENLSVRPGPDEGIPSD